MFLSAPRTKPRSNQPRPTVQIYSWRVTWGGDPAQTNLRRHLFTWGKNDTETDHACTGFPGSGAATATAIRNRSRPNRQSFDNVVELCRHHQLLGFLLARTPDGRGKCHVLCRPRLLRPCRGGSQVDRHQGSDDGIQCFGVRPRYDRCRFELSRLSQEPHATLMRPTIGQLKGWDLSGLSVAGSTFAAHAASLDGELDQFQRAIDTAAQWHGKTHDAATRKVTEERDHGHEVRNVLNRLSDALGDAERELTHARAYTISNVDSALSQGFTVSDTGKVHHPDPDRRADAEHLAFSIGSGLDEVERLDTLYGTMIGEASQDLGAMKNGQPDIRLPNGQRADPDDVVAGLARMTADERAAFLGSLSPRDLQALVDANPDVMGNLDGVPFTTRVGANEINIRNALIDERQKTDPNEKRITQLQAMLAPVKDPANTGLKNDLAPATGPHALNNDGLMNRQFVAFSTNGNGRMIEMVGTLNPGSKGVGVYVPGTGSNLDGSNTNHNAAWNLAQLSESPVFLYMNGELPQDLITEAPFPDDARSMAPGLLEFGKEVDRAVAETTPGTQVTYIGHSYGGSVLGSAEQLGLRADRILYASSAGTGVFDGPWDNADPNVQRYSMTAPGDLVGMTQSINQGVNPHGSDPDEMPGITRLDTGYYGTGSDEHRPGEVVFGTDGHGDYWNDRSSTAFVNMAEVIKGGEVTGYVERGIESNNIDIDLGDVGSGGEEGIDAGLGIVLPGVSGLDLPGIPGITPPIRVPEFAEDPYGNPHVTDNPGLGPRIDID